MGAQIPNDHIITRPAKLDGDAQVSFPYGTDHRRVERYFSVFRGTPARDWKAVDREYSTTLLIDRSVIGGDNQKIYIAEVYEDVPGPWIYDTRYDDDLGPVQIRRRTVLFDAANVSTSSATGKKTYAARGTSTLVSWETEESWSDGTGGEGNPAYPIVVGEAQWDRERGSVRTATQVVPYDEGNDAILTFTPDEEETEVGTVTEIDYLKFGDGQHLQRRVVKTFRVPGPVLTSTDLDELTGLEIPTTTQLVYAGSVHPEITERFHSFSATAIDSATSRFVSKIYPEDVLDVTRTDWVPDSITWPEAWVGIGGTITGLASFLSRRIIAERAVKFSRREVTTFQDTEPTMTEIMEDVKQISPVRLDLRPHGVGIISGRAILVDSITIGGETMDASSPNASTYALNLGSTTAFLIQPRRSKKIANGLWAITTPAIPYPAASTW